MGIMTSYICPLLIIYRSKLANIMCTHRYQNVIPKCNQNRKNSKQKKFKTKEIFGIKHGKDIRTSQMNI